jgi:flagellar hook-basal body complex protein FliE
MTINSVSPNLINLLSNDALAFDPGRTGAELTEGSFADILTEAFSTASQTDAVDKASSVELLMGQNDDLVGLMLDAQKAEISLNLALQIRNKVIDAYNEIMRMQV